MASGAKDSIAPHVHKLITHITGLSQKEDPHNFKLCEKYAITNLLHHRFLTVDAHAIRRSVFGMVTKFMIHGHMHASRKLDSLLNKFLNNNEIRDKELQWSLLSLLLKLSNNPTNHENVEEAACGPSVKKEETSKNFDWTTYSHLCSYLQEGNEEFNTDFNASSDNEDWDDESSPTSSPPPSPPDMAEIDAELMRCNVLEERPVDGSHTRREKFLEVQNRRLSSENWLSDNVQHGWWGSKKSQEKVDSEFSSADLCRNVSGIEAPNSEPPSTVSEYKIVREVLWMIDSPTTTTTFRKNKNGFSVQPDISITSLTKDAVHNYLNQFCQYFKMLYDISEFGQQIQISNPLPSIEDQNNLPSRTFEAYSSALKEFVLELQELAVNIERKVRAQENIYTLYSLSRELGPKLKQLSTVYSVHEIATENWTETPNFIAASRLLSVLYFEATSCMECDRPCNLLRLFLRSFRPYVEIIDTWLMEGILDDEREEFVIVKGNYADGGMWDDGYAVRPYIEDLDQRGIKSLPLLQIIATKVLHAGRSMQLLQRLDRLGDMVVEGRPGEMYLEFLEELESCILRLSKEKTGSPTRNQYEPDSILTLVPSEPLKIVEMAITEVASRLENLNEDFLMKAYKDYLVPKLLERHSSSISTSSTYSKAPLSGTSSTCSKVPLSGTSSTCSKLPLSGTRSICSKAPLSGIETVYKKLSAHSTCGLMPLMAMMERIITGLIDAKHEAACLLVKNIFMKEFALPTHLMLIRAIYLMEAGDVMHRFSLYIFKEVENKLAWTNSYALTLLLEECINFRFPDHSSKFSIALRNDATLNGTPSVMDEIVVKYAVDWPLNIILSPKHMESYNSVFQFLLKVKWALWCLEDIRFSDLTKRITKVDLITKRRTRLLHLLRFWLIHAIGSVHTYLMGQVLHSLGMQLERDLANASDLDSLVQVHDNYVNLIYTHCLQPQSSDIIKTAILQLVRLSLQLREQWCQCVENIDDADLNDMVEMYIKCHYFLGAVLQNSVDSGDSPHLAGLSTAINTSAPTKEILQ